MNRVCVYCGSNLGDRPGYAEAARELGRLLAERGLGVVYGGANRGTMGELANAALDAGGEVIGVIPHGLIALEVAHEGLTRMHEVETLHQRKAKMLELSEALVVLPGGNGTHDELFEALTWLQLGIHAKPVGVLNVGGYYDLLLAHLDRAVEEGFLHPPHREMLLVDTDATRLLARFEEWVPPESPSWKTSP